MEWNWKKFRFDKTQCIIFVLLGVLLLVIVIPTKKTETKKNQTDTQTTAAVTKTSSETDEERLSQILSQVEGVGEVQVLVTYKDQGRQVVLQDKNSSSTSTVEEDKEGGKRTTDEVGCETTTVFDGNDAGNSPYVTQQMTPEIEGILVVAEGGGKTAVKQQILEAIKALFPVDVNKISIVKMK